MLALLRGIESGLHGQPMRDLLARLRISVGHKVSRIMGPFRGRDGCVPSNTKEFDP